MLGEVMKSLIRWGTTLGLVGSTVLATVTSSISSAIALSEQQITQKLSAIPVWMVTNPQGLPLSRPLAEKNGKKTGGSVTGVYMSKQEAQAFINDLQKVKNKDPKMTQMVKSLQVTTVPLGVIFQQVQQTKNQPNRLLFAFKPADKEVKAAMNLLKKNGQQVKEFKSVPVFITRFAPDKSYVPIKLGDKKSEQEVVPLFFSMQDAQNLLNQVKPKFPKADIQVVDVDGILNTLQEKDDPWLQKVVFFPNAEARDYIQKLPKQNTPNPAPKK